ncbi:TetR/AcrR family transcriptional regulator [Curtobacterium sp. MCBD17_028]|uniref:TetR/AcrR family transcriptional regulator n=1 Tax=Curtobacterium sp. MCBD17_028 TaxID=2175670 RepID=UPI000DA73EE7|nr:TetR/AcrR family transcriptional regulator [Curtobacterium sp. MCBD17_028]PZE23574.1 TetR family transcriptional regulator [Curtobacterium sp. MCBD17_028]
MARWDPDARARLEQAALELFREQGFAATTVPQITARAGLTTRTFFRHFADKREVLFGFEDQFPAVVAELLAQAPPDLAPIALIAAGLETLAETRFQPLREYLLTHRAVVRSDERLRERELTKHAALARAVRAGFVERGEDDLSATLAAEVSGAVWWVSLDRWLDEDGDRALVAVVRETMARFLAITGGGDLSSR